MSKSILQGRASLLPLPSLPLASTSLLDLTPDPLEGSCGENGALLGALCYRTRRKQAEAGAEPPRGGTQDGDAVRPPAQRRRWLVAEAAVLRDPRKPFPGQELPKRGWQAPTGLLRRPSSKGQGSAARWRESAGRGGGVLS